MTKLGMKRTTPRKPMKKRLPKDYALDRMWSQIVRSSGRCVVCGETNKILHAHHWVGRRYKHTRWEISNGVPLCHQCHQELHDMPKFRKDIERKFLGADKMEQLELMARRGVGTKVDKEAIKSKLTELIKGE